MKYVASPPFNHPRKSLHSCIETCTQVAFVKLFMWNIILWLLGVFLSSDFIVHMLYRHSCMTYLDRKSEMDYVCCDFSNLLCCPIKERFHINLVMALVRKEHFFFLIKTVLAFSLMLRDFQYVFCLSLFFCFHSYQCFVFGKDKKKFCFL